jgi:hypothetical protein
MSLTEAIPRAALLRPLMVAPTIVVLTAKASWELLISPVLTGAIANVLLAIVDHCSVSRRPYPIKLL